MTVTLLAALLTACGPPATPAHPPRTPRERRAAREACVAQIHRDRDRQAVRALVECDYGDEAVLALRALPLDDWPLLAEAHVAGKLERLRPRELMLLIARHGIDVARFAVARHQELEEPAARAAFLEDPLPYCLSLKHLEEGAAEVRARQAAERAATPFTRDWRNLALLGCAGAAAVLLVQAIRRRRQPAP